ncbi:hypothetical protein LTS18_003397 [Coniosporium uncinatum]|uniref:Uncharacterized protein n=1 Tax=Coniosporium uncinatum TaxID=93489 RepID=A0ACC3DYG1_9PEZI|nr:hypothetical protein LTS18_003397 [Coniosporium uncinatum]
MPSLKRKSYAASTDATTSNKEARLSGQDLQELDKDALIKQVLDLQNELDPLKAQPVAGSPALSNEQVAEKAEHARKLMVRGIEKQMKVLILVPFVHNPLWIQAILISSKWKPSCKNGSARFSYEGVVASPAVFQKLFNLPQDSKKKMF